MLEFGHNIFFICYFTLLLFVWSQIYAIDDEFVSGMDPRFEISWVTNNFTNGA